MSKAFTRDDAPASDPLDELPDARPQGPRPFTPEGHARLQAELAAARAALPPPSPDDATARAARRAAERRLARITALYDAAVVHAPPPAPSRAVFATWVTVEDADGALATYRLVGPDEADPAAGAISVTAPLGRALLGRAPGDELTVERPAGPLELTLLAVHAVPPPRRG